MGRTLRTVFDEANGRFAARDFVVRSRSTG